MALDKSPLGWRNYVNPDEHIELIIQRIKYSQMAKQEKKQDIYQEVTNYIIEAIENGQAAENFQMPWVGFTSIPLNVQTAKYYRGINIFILWLAQMNSNSSYWGTYKQ